MRAVEFLKKDFITDDIWEIHGDSIIEHYSPCITESDKQDYERLREVFDDFAIDPQLGKDYYFCSSVVIVPARFIEMAHTQKPYKLVKFENSVYSFDIDGTVKSFPDQKRLEDMTRRMNIFPNLLTMDQMISFVSMTFSGDYNVKIRPL